MEQAGMKKLTLILNGHFAGKTVRLSGTLFTEGKVVLQGPIAEVENLANYLGKCYQAWPEGKTLQVEGEKNGTSDLHKAGCSDVSSEVREEKRPAEEVPTDQRSPTNAADVHERRGVPSGSGHENAGLPSPEDRFSGTGSTKVDPSRLLGAMSKLDPSNLSHWRSDGLPKLDAICEAYGSTGITRKDVNAVWPELTREVLKAEQQMLDKPQEN